MPIDDVPTQDFLRGGGEMGALTRGYDWTKTPLGPPDGWPQSLKTAVRLLLTSQHPMFIWWGPELIQFYNDAYRQTMGPERHPSALGQYGYDCWTEIWDIIGPQIEFVMAGKGATWHVDQLAPVTRQVGERMYGGPMGIVPLISRARSAAYWWSATIDDAAPSDGAAATGQPSAWRREHPPTTAISSIAWVHVHTPRTPACSEFTNASDSQLIVIVTLSEKRHQRRYRSWRTSAFSNLLDQVYASGKPFVGGGRRILQTQTNRVIRSDVSSISSINPFWKSRKISESSLREVMLRSSHTKESQELLFASFITA